MGGTALPGRRHFARACCVGHHAGQAHHMVGQEGSRAAAMERGVRAPSQGPAALRSGDAARRPQSAASTSRAWTEPLHTLRGNRRSSRRLYHMPSTCAGGGNQGTGQPRLNPATRRTQSRRQHVLPISDPHSAPALPCQHAGPEIVEGGGLAGQAQRVSQQGGVAQVPGLAVGQRRRLRTDRGRDKRQRTVQ